MNGAVCNGFLYMNVENISPSEITYEMLIGALAADGNESQGWHELCICYLTFAFFFFILASKLQQYSLHVSIGIHVYYCYYCNLDHMEWFFLIYFDFKSHIYVSMCPCSNLISPSEMDHCPDLKTSCKKGDQFWDLD